MTRKAKRDAATIAGIEDVIARIHPEDSREISVLKEAADLIRTFLVKDWGRPMGDWGMVDPVKLKELRKDGVWTQEGFAAASQDLLRHPFSERTIRKAEAVDQLALGLAGVAIWSNIYAFLAVLQTRFPDLTLRDIAATFNDATGKYEPLDEQLAKRIEEEYLTWRAKHVKAITLAKSLAARVEKRRQTRVKASKRP